MSKNKTESVETPWGAVKSSDVIAHGIEFIRAEEHAGIHLSPQRNAGIPFWLKEVTLDGQGVTGWYENNCDWCIPMIVFASEFGRWNANAEFANRNIEKAYSLFRSYFMPMIERPAFTLSGITGQAESEKRLYPGLYLGLYHGRRDVAEDMKDWGSRGPLIGPLENLTTTYMTDIRLMFKERLDALKYGLDIDLPELSTKQDCIEYRGVYYGDWQALIVNP